MLRQAIKRCVSPVLNAMGSENKQALKRRIFQALEVAGYEKTDWIRIVQNQDISEYLRGLPLGKLDALEISPGRSSLWRRIGFGSYTEVDYPAFDVTKETLPRTFDVIIADNVFEHVRHPYAGARNVHAMLKDDGVFVIVTPFLVRVHKYPTDFTRWTPDGLQAFLEDCGFTSEVRAWGNRHAVVGNFDRWAAYGWRRDMRNEPNLPAVVWAYARKA